MESERKRRKVINARYNWSRVEADLFLQLVLQMKDRFEKPTARLFYTQLAEKEQSLACFSWKAMRDKMKNMKNKYKAAIAWRSNTGAGLDEEDKERTIRDQPRALGGEI
uniref:Myb/SANT-like DNA-binding domain-containing protein n=1 Tax=Lygus hesperus TaxID=30085 RepID=A0A146M689_LYGHE